MTKDEFKQRWESNDNGGGITFDDIAKCALAWGLFSTPRTSRIDLVRHRVLVAADVVDAQDYAPDEANN